MLIRYIIEYYMFKLQSLYLCKIYDGNKRFVTAQIVHHQPIVVVKYL